MFPSNKNINGYYDPVHFTNDPSIFNKPFFNDIIPNSKLGDASLSFLHFPLDDHDDFLHELLLQHQPLGTDNIPTVSESVVDMVYSTQNELNNSPNVTTQQPPRRKAPAPKKDRHSKINTARGLRDRRMRLSLEVARRFFKLQDMLGYDKASKTVEWLLSQAKHEIEKLEGHHPCIVNNILEGQLPQIVNYSYSAGAKSSSSTNECEVVSGVHKAAINSEGSKPSIKANKIRQSRKNVLRPPTRDMRNKARARARERTRRKMFGRNLETTNLSNQLLSCSSFENGEESGLYENCSLDVVAGVEEQGSEHLANLEQFEDDSVVVMEKWSPTSSFNYPHNIGTPEEHQFPDFQFFGKP
ncbi:transcription factor CYCLOIDEA-like [Pistacia vera]|uniref:transcription factor CYCLOIDEA-like n=1 Tax=Pistacia vera TaxID=55513 RepID=UPI001262B43A|nr:transcription factor CYCLOIDEA-like [Pistacia vera]